MAPQPGSEHLIERFRTSFTWVIRRNNTCVCITYNNIIMYNIIMYKIKWLWAIFTFVHPNSLETNFVFRIQLKLLFFGIERLISLSYLGEIFFFKLSGSLEFVISWHDLLWTFKPWRHLKVHSQFEHLFRVSHRWQCS